MAARRALLPACARALDCRLSPPLRCGCASLASGGAPARTALPPSRRANFRLCAAGIAEAEAAELTSSKGRPTFLFRAASLNTASETASTLTDDDDEKLELLDPDFYRMGYVRDVRAYGVEFKEGPKGVGVYFTNDIPSVKVPLTVLEIPVEIMVTVSKEPPWIFRPDFLPLGDPLFPVINSTNAEADWDIRLACMLLLGLHQEGNFWHFYGDFLPPLEECPSLLLATQAELAELEEPQLEQYMAGQQRRLEAFWAQHWASADVPFNLAQLCQSKEQFKWAVAQVWSRSQLVHCIFSSLRQDTHLLCPYADMLNHSYDPNCAFRWRKHDQMLEVYIMAGQSIRKGDEVLP